MSGLSTKRDVAEYLKITIEEVDVLVSSKRMPFIELPGIDEPERFHLKLIDEWLERKVKTKKKKKQPTFNEITFIIVMARQGLSLEYELKRFKLKNTSYLPDFYCKENNTWYEVSSTKSCYEYSRPKILELLEILNNTMTLIMVRPDGTKLDIDNPELNTWK
jgi:hypothetical protein